MAVTAHSSITDITRIVTLITEASSVQRILTQIAEPAQTPPVSPARGLPARDDVPVLLPDWESIAPPEPE